MVVDGFDVQQYTNIKTIFENKVYFEFQQVSIILLQNHQVQILIAYINRGRNNG